MNMNIVKLFAIVVMCFMIGAALVACGADGKDGTNGKDGVGVQSAVINDDGELVITYTDGKTENLGKVVGEDGEDLTCGDSVHVWGEGVVVSNHKYDAETKIATVGVTIYQCEICKTAKAEFVDHVFTDVVTAPTCVDAGFTTHTCDCGYSYEDTPVEALGHEYTSEFNPADPDSCEGWTKAPIDASLVAGVDYCPCTYEHNYSSTCVREGCGYEEVLAADAEGHHWGEEKESVNLENKPDCQWNRPMFHECTVCTCAETETFDCGRVENTRELGAKPHDYTGVEGDVTTEPTCTTAGVKSFKCTYCGEYTKTAEIPALGHDIENHNALAPTCTGTGWDAYETCKREGCTYTTRGEDIPALGHTHTVASEVVLVAPTADAAGSLKFLCDVCDEVADTVELPALTAENCGEEGFYTKDHKGTHCGDWVDTYTFTVTVGDAELTKTLEVNNFSDHTEYVEGVTATRTVEGDNNIYTVYKCEKCGMWVVVHTEPKPATETPAV